MDSCKEDPVLQSLACIDTWARMLDEGGNLDIIFGFPKSI